MNGQTCTEIMLCSEMNLRKIQSNCALYCTSVLHASALGALLCLGDWVVGYAAICSHCSSKPSGHHVVDGVIRWQMIMNKELNNNDEDNDEKEEKE